MELSSRKSLFARISPPARILLGMFAGAAVGMAFGPRIAGLGEIGKVVIALIKMLATPLILFVVLDALLRSFRPRIPREQNWRKPNAESIPRFY